MLSSVQRNFNVLSVTFAITLFLPVSDIDKLFHDYIYTPWRSLPLGHRPQPSYELPLPVHMSETPSFPYPSKPALQLESSDRESVLKRQGSLPHPWEEYHWPKVSWPTQSCCRTSCVYGRLPLREVRIQS